MMVCVPIQNCIDIGYHQFPPPLSLGNVLIYDIHGKLVRSFLLLDVVTTSHVLECHFWGNGVVAITSDMQIFVAEVTYRISYARFGYSLSSLETRVCLPLMRPVRENIT